jgi:hypothetical protein
VQIIVPNGGVWGQPLRNFGIYPAPPHAGEVRFRTAEGTELEPAVEKVRAIVEAHPRVLADPAPSVLLDRSATENAIEIVTAFSTAEDETAAVKSCRPAWSGDDGPIGTGTTGANHTGCTFGGVGGRNQTGQQGKDSRKGKQHRFHHLSLYSWSRLQVKSSACSCTARTRAGIKGKSLGCEATLGNYSETNRVAHPGSLF